MTKIYAEKYHHRSMYLECNGHANYDEYGKDIVCAAISVLCYSLEEWCKKHGQYLDKHEVNIHDGYFEISIKGDSEAEAVFDMVVDGLKLIEKEQPKFLKIEYIEG